MVVSQCGAPPYPLSQFLLVAIGHVQSREKKSTDCAPYEGNEMQQYMYSTPLDGGSGGGGGGPDIKSSWLNCYIAVIGRDDDIHGHIPIGHPILVHTSPTRDRSPMLKLSSLQPRRDETSHPCFALGVGVLYGVRMMGTYILSMRSSRMHSLCCATCILVPAATRGTSGSVNER
jgi:hypothetical protein